MPDDLANEPKTPLAILMLFSSNRITRKKRFVPEAKILMGDYAKDILTAYYEIFNENSKGQRVAFFRDRII